MSQFSLYLDEDSHATGLAEALLQAGMDVLRSTEYLAAGRFHAGIIIWPKKRRYGIGEQARRILHLWQTRTIDDMANHVEFLGQWGEGRP